MIVIDWELWKNEINCWEKGILKAIWIWKVCLFMKENTTNAKGQKSFMVCGHIFDWSLELFRLLYKIWDPTLTSYLKLSHAKFYYLITSWLLMWDLVNFLVCKEICLLVRRLAKWLKPYMAVSRTRPNCFCQRRWTLYTQPQLLLIFWRRFTLIKFLSLNDVTCCSITSHTIDMVVGSSPACLILHQTRWNHKSSGYVSSIFWISAGYQL